MNTKDNIHLVQPVETVSEDTAVRAKLTDVLIPGFQVEFDPDEADQAGAFIEDALSEQDALESSIDLNNIG